MESSPSVWRFSNVRFRTRLALILFPTMLVGIFAAVYLAFRFTRPVDMLVEGAKQVAGGNMYVSLPVPK